MARNKILIDYTSICSIAVLKLYVAETG